MSQVLHSCAWIPDDLRPVAALAAVIEHQADGTVLVVGLSLAALIEVVLVGWVWEESIGLSGTEASSSAAAATAAAATTAAATAAAATTGLGLSVCGWCDWRQGVRTRSTSWGEKWKYRSSTEIFSLQILQMDVFLMRTGSSSQSTLDGVDQRVSSLATESATEIIQIQTPHHGSTETALLQPLNL